MGVLTVAAVEGKAQEERQRPYVAIAFLAGVDLAMKAVAITTAVRRGDKKWILPLALINSVGILPTVYLATRRSDT